MSDSQEKIDKILETLKPKQKQLADLLFSDTDAMTRIHRVQNMMLDILADPVYLSRLSADEWTKVFSALTEADAVKGSFINEQARLSKDAPTAVQNVFAILAGQLSTNIANNQIVDKTSVNSVESAATYEIPAEILPIKQAIQSTLDARVGIDREAIIDVEVTNEEDDSDSSNK